MEHYQKFYAEFIADLYRYEAKLKKQSEACKRTDDISGFREFQIRLGVLAMTEAVFKKHFDRSFGIRPIVDRPKLSRQAFNPAKINATNKEEQILVKNFFQFGRLKQVPVGYKRKRTLAEILAREFESDRTYSEEEVNDTLSKFFPDYCTLRRLMIELRIMERKSGSYWLTTQRPDRAIVAQA